MGTAGVMSEASTAARGWEGQATPSWAPLRIDMESDEWDRILATALPVFVVTLDADGAPEFFSESYLSYTGLTVEQARNWLDHQVVHPDDHARARTGWDEFLSKDGSYRSELRLRRFDGEYRWFLVQGMAVRGENGRIERRITTGIDIHAPKRFDGRQPLSLELASAVSGDGSEVGFDLSAVLAATARRAVELLGDGCTIQLLSDDGETLTLGAAHHRDARALDLMRDIFAVHSNPAREGLPALVLSASEPLFLPHVNEAVVRSASNPHLHPLFDLVGMSSAIALPIRAGDKVLGTLTCSRDRGSPGYREEDVLVAQELGSRAALAIQHAKNLAALALSESTYRRLAESIPACVLVTARGGAIEYCNGFALDYVGLSLEYFQEHGWPAIIHPGDIERAGAGWRKAMRSGNEYANEFRMRRHDGVFRWHLGRTLRIANERGEAERFVNIAIDIHDRRQAEDRQRLRMEASDLAAHPFDAAATLARFASVVVPRLADSAATFVRADDGASITAMSHDDPSMEPNAREAILELVGTGAGRASLERALLAGESYLCANVGADESETRANGAGSASAGRLEPSSFMVTPLKWQERIFGALTLVNFDPYRRFTPDDLALAEDLAEKASAAMENARLYEEATQTAIELREANRAKDDFLGLVSHELRTPITVILGDAAVLRRRATQLDDESRASALQDIHSEAERLNRIIENLLMLARLEHESEETEPIDASRVLGSTVERFRRQSPGRQVTLSDETDGAFVNASAFAIEHALLNLLSNADKYSPVVASIEVSADRLDDQVVISVADRGAGVPDGEFDRIFEPFFRSGAASVTSGVGIGLTVCRRLIEANGGHIWAESRNGSGLIVTFALPTVNFDAIET